MIKAIPTTYRGINMRSRLEAKWACVFDQLGWNWQYEPLDFDGWIPDFIVDGHGHAPLLIDVKPFSSFGESHDLSAKIGYALGKSLIDEYGVFVTRAYPMLVKPDDACPVGWVSECYEDDEGKPKLMWDDAIIRWLGPGSNVYGLCAYNCSYYDRVTGYYDGSISDALSYSEFMPFWHKATNATQWKRAA
jgi:hypothetical protein